MAGRGRLDRHHGSLAFSAVISDVRDEQRRFPARTEPTDRPCLASDRPPADVSSGSADGVVHISHHLLFLRDEEVVPDLQRRRSNGHCEVLAGAIAVQCGTHTGMVAVSVEVRDNPPEDHDLTEWSEVTDVDLRPVEASLRVAALFDDPPEHLVGLTPPGHPAWRVRVLSRGRDNAGPEVIKEPVEEHCFVIWPTSEPREPVILRQIDNFGAMWRASTRNYPEEPSVATPPPPPPELPQRARTRKAGFRATGWHIAGPAS
jgi:hypothetical protein